MVETQATGQKQFSTVHAKLWRLDLQLSGGGGGRAPLEKGWGCLSESLKRTPKRYQGPVGRGGVWVEIFSPLRGVNSETK